MHTVLVLDANQRSALAVTRSLGARGIRVVTADETPSALAAASRFSAAYETYPSPATDSEAFLASITGIIDDHHIDMLMPMTELSVTLLNEHRARLGDVRLPFPDSETIEKLADKCRLVELAGSLGIPCPASVCLAPGDPLPAITDQPDRPVVLKPGKSWLHTGAGWLHSSVRFAANRQQASELIAADAAFQVHPYLLQQEVPGSGRGVFALYDHGEAVAFFAHRRIHEKPPRGGVSVISESVDTDPELLACSKSLLDAVGWHGIAMVEFRVDEQHGGGRRAWLMEVNTRFWGSLQLAIDAGVDFPWLLYRLTSGERPAPVSEYHRGRRLRWLLGDLDWLYLVLRDAQFPVTAKLKAIMAFFWAPFTTRNEVFRLSDPGPSWQELKEYMAHVLRRR